MGGKELASNKIRRTEKLQLSGSLKKKGFDRWRLVTNGTSVISGEEKTFFIEFYVVNPAVSSQKYVLGFKNRFDKSAEDFQFVLAGTDSAKNIASQEFVIPSFFMIRVGVLSVNGCSINSYFNPADLLSSKKNYIISVKNSNNTECTLSSDYTEGSVVVTENDLTEHPEFMGKSGSLSWKLKFSKEISFSSDYRSKDFNWSVIGNKTDFSGTINFNGEEFSVNPRNSFGYYDKNWGRDFTSPYFHLSSSNLTSEISGFLLRDSSFAVQGEFENKLSVLACVDGKNIEFHADKLKKHSIIYNCQEVVGHEDGEAKLHWTVSVHNKKYVLDIDIFCNVNAMSLRDLESPSGNRKVLRVLGSGIGTGRFKLYKKMKKTLELIEQAKVSKCLCEYGNLEDLSGEQELK